VNISPRLPRRVPTVAAVATSSCIIVPAALEAALKLDPTPAPASRGLLKLKG